MSSPLAHKLAVLLFGINLLASTNAYFELTDDESDGKETNENTREIVDQQCRRRLDKLEQSLVPTDLLGWIVIEYNCKSDDIRSLSDVLLISYRYFKGEWMDQ